MKIKELLEQLSDLNPELDIVIAGDEEGNYFHNFYGFSFGYWDQEDFHSYLLDEDGEEIYPTIEYSEENANAICFWP